MLHTQTHRRQIAVDIGEDESSDRDAGVFEQCCTGRRGDHRRIGKIGHRNGECLSREQAAVVRADDDFVLIVAIGIGRQVPTWRADEGQQSGIGVDHKACGVSAAHDRVSEPLRGQVDISSGDLRNARAAFGHADPGVRAATVAGDHRGTVERGDIESDGLCSRIEIDAAVGCATVVLYAEGEARVAVAVGIGDWREDQPAGVDVGDADALACGHRRARERQAAGSRQA